MMDPQSIKTKLDKWLVEFVEAKHPELNNWAPCPYAKAARLSNMIEVVFCEVSEFNDVIRESVNMLEHKDVVVVCFDHNNIDPVTLQEWVSSMNETLMPANYVILDDHPDAPEYVNRVNMNFGHCGLLVLQKLDKLNNHASKLKEQGYYDSWDQRALNEVVLWRYEK